MPVQGDVGPQTISQMINAVIVDHAEDNGAKSRRKVRENHLIKMTRPNGSGKAILTLRQAAAGIKLEEAWNSTQRSPGPAWTRVYVDSTPRPGDVDTKKLEASAEYAALRILIPRDCRKVVEAVCCAGYSVTRLGHGNDRRIGALKIQLQRGLDILGREMKI
jgi:hypothetical protein